MGLFDFLKGGKKDADPSAQQPPHVPESAPLAPAPASQPTPDAAPQTAPQGDASMSPAEAGTGGPQYQGGPLSFKRPVSVETMHEHAEDFSQAFANIEGAPLDYSLESLAKVDALLGEFEVPGSDALAQTIFTVGAYIGEVVIRHGAEFGYRWVFLDADDPIAPMMGFRMVIKNNHGAFANPIGKAFKRVDQGPTDSVRFFAEAELSGARRNAAER